MRWRRFCLAGTGYLLDRGDLVVDCLHPAFEPVDLAPLRRDHVIELVDGLVLKCRALFERRQSFIAHRRHRIVRTPASVGVKPQER